MNWTRVVVLSGLVLLVAIFAISPFGTEPQDTLAQANDRSGAVKSVDRPALLSTGGRRILKMGGQPIANPQALESAITRSDPGDCAWQYWHGDPSLYWTDPDVNLATDRFVRFEAAGECTLMASAVAIYEGGCEGTPTARIRVYGNNGPIHDGRMYPGDDAYGPGDPSNLVAEVDITWADLAMFPQMHTIDWTTYPGWPAGFVYGPGENVFVSLSLSPNTPNPTTDVLSTISDDGTGGGDGRSGAHYLESVYLYNDVGFGTDYSWITESYFCCATNQPPEFEPLADQIVYEGELLSLTVAADDFEGDPLHFYTAPLPPNAAFISATQEFSWMPAWDQEGIYEITFFVSDGYSQDVMTIVVEVLPSRYGPAILPLGRYHARQGELVKIYVGRNVIGSTFEEESDVQFPPLVSGLPPGMTYDPGDSSLTWEVPLSASGEYPGITISVTDDDGGTDMTTGSIVVMPQLPLGDLDGDSFPTPLDLSNLIDCLFGGTCARPLDNYDFNASGFTDPLDLALFIDYLFVSGPPPYEKPRVSIGRPGTDGLIVGPLEVVTATDVSSAPIARIYFEYSLDQAGWLPIDSTDHHPAEQALDGNERTIERYWRTADLPPGTAWLRAISEDTVHNTADTAVVQVVINRPPTAGTVVHYDPLSGVAAFDMRTSYDLDNGMNSFARWRFTNDTLDLTLYGPVVQLNVAPGDSFGYSMSAEDLAGAAAALAYCVNVTEEAAVAEEQTDCECTDIEVVSSGRIFAQNYAVWRRMLRWHMRASQDLREDRFGTLDWWDFLALGPMVDLTETSEDHGVVRYAFLVHVSFIGDATHCDWGQKVQRTAKAYGRMYPKSDGALNCPYEDPDKYCTDNYRPGDEGNHWMDIAKADVWWYDAPGWGGLSDNAFDAAGRPDNMKGVEYHAKFKAWASPDGGGDPDCCTACWEVNMAYDKNQNPNPNPGGEPTLSGFVTPCPAPHNTCDPDDPNR